MAIADLPRVRGSVIIDRYSEAVDVLSSESCVTRSFEPESAPFKGGTVSEVNGAVHQSHRRLAAPAFGRHAVLHYEDSVLGEAIERALDRVRRAGDTGPGAPGADLVSLSQLILVQVAASFIGLDGTDNPPRLERLLCYVGRLGPGVELRWAQRDTDEIVRDGLAAKAGFALDFYEPAMRQRQQTLSGPARDGRQPPDLISGLCAAEWDEDRKLREAITYMTAGIRATAHIVTRTFDELERWLAVRLDARDEAYSPQGLREACNETLRLHPSSPALFREAAAPIPRASGQPIPAGARIAIDLLACNTDVSVFGPDAARFRPGREVPEGVPRYGLSFGAGRHVCPGRSVVTANGPVAARDGQSRELLRAVVRILHRLHECGMEADPARQPAVARSYQRRYEFYPVRFSCLDRVKR